MREEHQECSFENAVEGVVSCLEAAEEALKKGKSLNVLTELRLAEHRVKVAEMRASTESHEQTLRAFRKRAADLRRRVSIVWRLIGRILQL